MKNVNQFPNFQISKFLNRISVLVILFVSLKIQLTAQIYFTEPVSGKIQTNKRLIISVPDNDPNANDPVTQFDGNNANYNSKISITNHKTLSPSSGAEKSITEFGTWGANQLIGLPPTLGMGYMSSNTGLLGFGMTGNPTGLLIKQTIPDASTATNYPNVIVGIGVKPNFGSGAYRLFVKDGIRTERVKVDIASTAGWADFVFDESYKLRSLEEVEKFIKANKHLPDVPSEKEIKKEGYELTDMHKIQMQKIEELTLYLIELKKENEALKKRLDKIEEEKKQQQEKKDVEQIIENR